MKINIDKYKDRRKFKKEASSLCKAAGMSKKQAKTFCNYFIRYIESSDIIAKRKNSEMLNETSKAYKKLFEAFDKLKRKPPDKEYKHKRLESEVSENE